MAASSRRSARLQNWPKRSTLRNEPREEIPPMPSTMKMTRRADRWPEPMLGMILSTLDQFPAARAAVTDALEKAKTAPVETADVHLEEVDNWEAMGWKKG